MGSDAFVNAREFNKSSVKKKMGNKQVKSKQNKVDVRKEEKLFHANKEQRAILPPPNRNGQEGQTTQNHQNTSARKHVTVPTKYNNVAVPYTYKSNVRRTDSYSLTSSKDFYGIRNSSCSSSCSGDDRDDGCLDDWEAMADALTAENSQRSSEVKRCGLRSNTSRTNYRAWSPNDVYCPRSLPSITRGSVFSWQSVVSHQPPTCPICCEDFDSTDSSFLPCPCGFRLCLFCHKTILEVDGRCPGCRKQYDCGSLSTGYAVQKTRSCDKKLGF